MAETPPEDVAESGWRADPGWELVAWAADYWTSPPRRPTPQAELTGGGLWCDHFVGSRSVATWFRPVESVR